MVDVRFLWRGDKRKLLPARTHLTSVDTDFSADIKIYKNTVQETTTTTLVYDRSWLSYLSSNVQLNSQHRFMTTSLQPVP